MNSIKSIFLLCLLYHSSYSQTDNLTLLKLKTDSIYFYNSAINSIDADVEIIKLGKLRQDLKIYGLHSLSNGEELIDHIAMSLVYSEEHEQPKWVAHIITADIINGVEGRSNDFRIDPKVKTGSAIEADYFLKSMKSDSTYVYDGFGYDRGHLAPSADFRWSATALSESFYYSNMSPMKPEFNRDLWAKLEDMFRAYIYSHTNSQLYIVTGPILHDKLPKISRAVNHVSIPEKFYKLAIDIDNKNAIAFIMSNTKIDSPIETYAVSIDEVEKQTGIDFYSGIDDALENELESISDPKPFLSLSEQGDILPDHPTKLPRNTFNTVMAKNQMGSGRKIRVLGTVVSTKLSNKGNVFLNLDKRFPNQIFSVSIFKDNMVNFSYRPEVTLEGRKIIVTGIVTDVNGTPTITIENEDAIEIVDK